MTTQQEKAQTLARLHAAPEILRVVNVWDVVSAKAVAALPETKALATAGHSIAATFGYPDGEKIPLELMLDMVGRIVGLDDLPVTADLDSGFGNPGETVRRAIGVGVVGANVEDRLRPLADSVAAVEAVIAAGEAEGVPFVLNARTDAFVRGGDRPSRNRSPTRSSVAARSSTPVPTSCSFPGILNADVTRQLVEGIGERKVSVIGAARRAAAAEYEALGVARISYGPMTQRVALTALQDVATDLYADGVIPPTTRALN